MSDSTSAHDDDGAGQLSLAAGVDKHDHEREHGTLKIYLLARSRRTI